MGILIYRFLILPLLFLGAHIWAIFNKRVRKALVLRYKVRGKLVRKKWTKPVIMIHASSLGEYEHIRPIIQILKDRYQFVITFFSPSGYENAGPIENVELHIYQPFDFYFIWKRIYRILKPQYLIISKHDVWPNQVIAARDMDIPVYLVNASLGPKSYRNSFPYTFIFKNAYSAINTIFAVGEEDALRFRKVFRHDDIRAMGDTKFDQVVIRQKMAFERDWIPKQWYVGKIVMVMGSIWPEDYHRVKTGLLKELERRENLGAIIVPHQPTEEFLQSIEREFKHLGVCRFSRVNQLAHEKIVLVDRVGVLAELYRYAMIAYVGGSFKQGIHNVMEAAVYGIPVIFGPEHENSFEALKMATENKAIVVHDAKEFHQHLIRLLDDELKRQNMGKKAKEFVQSHTGATERILQVIEKRKRGSSLERTPSEDF